MEFLYVVNQLFCGLFFLFFGLNGFFKWMPLPPMSEKMEKFSCHLNEAKIFLPVIKVCEVIAGTCLVFRSFTLPAALLLCPICFFIAVAHLKFNRPKGYAMAALVSVFAGLLLSQHFSQLLALLN